MKIHLTYMAQIKTIIGIGKETVEIDDSAHAQDLINLICDKYGADLEKLLLDDNKRLRRVILLFLGDEQCFWDDNPALTDQQQVTFMSPIAGGA